MAYNLRGSAEKPRVFRVKIEQGKSGVFLATSPDLKGLLAAGDTMDELMQEIPRSIQAIICASGEAGMLVQAEDLAGEHPMKSWVEIPADTNLRREYA